MSKSSSQLQYGFRRFPNRAKNAQKQTNLSTADMVNAKLISVNDTTEM